MQTLGWLANKGDKGSEGKISNIGKVNMDSVQNQTTVIGLLFVNGF